MQVTHAAIILLSSTFSSANVYTESAIFERLCHFKNDGVVNHLNTVDQAIIADGACHMMRSELDGYALWHNPATTSELIAALMSCYPLPSHATLFSLRMRSWVISAQWLLMTGVRKSTHAGVEDMTWR